MPHLQMKKQPLRGVFSPRVFRPHFRERKLFLLRSEPGTGALVGRKGLGSHLGRRHRVLWGEDRVHRAGEPGMWGERAALACRARKRKGKNQASQGSLWGLGDGGGGLSFPLSR